MNTYTKEWIESIDKTINTNGCWIPFYKPKTSGYVNVHIGGIEYCLHRVVLDLYHGIDYSRKDIVTRHSIGCDHACFNPEHIKPGTQKENIIDSVLEKTQKEVRKEVCPICGGPYHTVRNRTQGQIKYQRQCRRCNNRRRKERRAQKKG